MNTALISARRDLLDDLHFLRYFRWNFHNDNAGFLTSNGDDPLWNMDISARNTVCIMIALGFLAFHTFLFVNLSDQLQTSLRRIDLLEELLQNATEQKSSKKTVVANSLEEVQMRLDTELGDIEGNDKVFRLLRRIKRLEKR